MKFKSTFWIEKMVKIKRVKMKEDDDGKQKLKKEKELRICVDYII